MIIIITSLLVGFLLTACAGGVTTDPEAQRTVVLKPSCDKPAPLTLYPLDNAIPDQYIVIFADSVSTPQKRTLDLAAKHDFTIRFMLEEGAPSGFVAVMSPPALQSLRCETDVAFVQQDQKAEYGRFSVLLRIQPLS